MTVKITNTNNAIPSVGNAPSSPRAGSSNAAHGAPATSPKASTSGATRSERVDISPLSARLQEVGAGETVNTARVAEIKQAISEGRFQINPERIADGLLASVRDMLGRESAGKPAA